MASANGVYFGQFVLGNELTELCAVKPSTFCLDAGDVTNEWAAMNYLNSTSAKEQAFIPLGVWRLENGMFQLLSAYENSVNTFDNTLWAHGDRVHQVTTTRFLKR